MLRTGFFTTESENLEFWIKHGSWTYCEKRKKLSELKLFPRFAKRPIVKAVKSCNCVDNRYTVPQYKDINDKLKELTRNEIIALRPLDMHVGQYKRLPNGYRRKTDKFRVTWSKMSVEDKINNIEDEDSRERCQEAFLFFKSR